MYLSWSATAYHASDDSGYDLNPVHKLEEPDRDRKRQRRSIFFAQPDSDSDDGAEYDDVGHHRSLNVFRGTLDKAQNVSTGIPSTPCTADPLRKGACLLTPSFPRRSSSPCLESTSTFVAVHEEPNSGFRHYMEDRSAAMTAGGVAYLGIYDGHGGIDASTFLQQHLLPNIKAHLQPGCDVHDALTAAYMATNAAFRATGSIQGSTATTVILNNKHLIAANVGDSPAFVVKKSGEVCSVIKEHKIEGDEAARIAAQGVPIYRSPTGPAYMGTPDGTRWLNMSRAFGDFVYPAISCEPYVCSLDVSDGKFLVMGSDGLTEKWPVAEAAQYLTQLASAGWSLPAICRRLVEHSLARGSTDNISCMVVDLEAYILHAEAAAPAVCDAPADTANVETVQATAVAATQQLSGGDASPGLLAVCTVCVKREVNAGLTGAAQRGRNGEEGYTSEQGSSLQLLLCNEESLGCEAPPIVLRRGSPRGTRVPVSGAALANCAANALGIGVGADLDGQCPRRQAEVQEEHAGASEAAAEGANPGQSGGPLRLLACCTVADGGGATSPACSSPEVREKHGEVTDDVDAPEGGRQATPQPAQTACRLPTPVRDEATQTWSKGANDGYVGAGEGAE